MHLPRTPFCLVPCLCPLHAEDSGWSRAVPSERVLKENKEREQGREGDGTPRGQRSHRPRAHAC